MFFTIMKTTQLYVPVKYDILELMEQHLKEDNPLKYPEQMPNDYQIKLLVVDYLVEVYNKGIFYAR